VLGQHPGIVHYTIGQRKGLGIGGRRSDDEPLYVVRLDPEAKRVIVGPRAALARHSVALQELNWLDAPPGPEGRLVEAKLRSAQAAVPATVMLTGPDTAVLELHAPQHGVAPGQAAVLYDGDRMLGGGFIARAERAAA